MTKIKDLPEHKRPREKLLEKGPAGLSDAELLAILIRTGRTGKSALEIASDLLKSFPPDRLASITHNDLLSIKGIESTKAATILAALELGKRAAGSCNEALPILDMPKAVVAQLAELRDKKKEYFMALYLNARNQLIRKETISIGTLTGSLVHPREVFEPAVRHLASSVILAHNHPSNNPEPSDNDLLLTEKLVRAGEIMDIAVVDHIIIFSNGYTSMKEKGLL
ncbi:MAG: DNA repair protein RadC [Candidatus Wallbacteria bacterium]|nr:DNA repair protein RadC [Candidatus Wallbacteria bacterium]